MYKQSTATSTLTLSLMALTISIATDHKCLTQALGAMDGLLLEPPEKK